MIKPEDREDSYSDITESPIEKILLKAIRELGLPEPEQQHEVSNDDGSLLTIPDFAYLRKKIAIYCDGVEFHLDKERWEKDRKIDRELILKHWKPIRFTGKEINRNPQDCAQKILDLLNI
ncbi:hypothetical protein LCGC14_1877920 [marine sediment metagenome]|uniref:DUF559 domain-containing protein n=1 Tax=marine sediment metagenome TaxID=412755 RepID=A0A0F9J1N1_9ZZZZ